MDPIDNDEVGTDSGTGGNGRRKFMAGAAGAAAAATAGVLATASPAGASVTSNDVDISGALKFIDFNMGSLSPVALGPNGFAKATFSPYGDMVAVTLRIVVGDDDPSKDLGSGPWCLDPTDSSFSGFAPVGLVNDVPNVITAFWQGTGAVIDIGSLNQNQQLLGSAWQDFTPVSPSIGSVMVWGVIGPRNNFDGNVLFNAGGTVPFGAPPAAGSVLYTTTAYQIII